jgi:hypothetical protein
MNKKMWDICIMEYCSALKKNEIKLFAGKWMELVIIMLRKITQAQKAKYGMFPLICRL